MAPCIEVSRSPGHRVRCRVFAAVDPRLHKPPHLPHPPTPSGPCASIVPAAPGGTTDTLARMFGERMTAVFNEQVVVDNRASASALLAATSSPRRPGRLHALPRLPPAHRQRSRCCRGCLTTAVNDFTPITQLTAAGLMSRRASIDARRAT